MTYKEMLQKARDSTSEDAKHQKEQLIVLIFRELGYYISPLFMIINVSANKITVLGLILGLFAAALIWNGYLFLGVLFLFVEVILDHVDGTIARVRGESTFFGRFMDGFCGIIVSTFTKLSLSGFVVSIYGFNSLAWLGIITTVLTPMHYLFYDRYSAFARWINEEHKNIHIKPYLRGEMPAYFNKLNDIQLILLFALPLFYHFNVDQLCISIYFLLNFYLALHTLFVYSFSAYKNFVIEAKPHR